MNTVLIKNGLVYEGTETKPVKRDILVKGDKIVQLGNFSHYRADEIIEATGAFIIPGIIDINTDSDHFFSLILDPYQEDFIKQGVTTIIGGNCGASLAPVLNITAIRESLFEWGGPYNVNINWHSIKDFLEVLDHQGLGVNFGTLVGHTTLRQAITKNRLRDLTLSELEILKSTLKKSLEEGAFGLSTNLNYFYARSIPYYEIIELVKIVAHFKKVFSLHLRDVEDGVISSVKEALEIARETKVNLEIAHFQPLKNFASLYHQAKEEIEKEGREVVINFDCYPFDSRVLPIYLFLPKWAQGENFLEMTNLIYARHLEKRLLEYFQRYQGNEIILGQMPPNFHYLSGKTLEEFAQSLNVSSNEALLRLMRLTRLKASLVFKDIDWLTLEDFLVSSRSIISSNGASLPAGEFKHERYFNTFPKFLKFIKENEKIPLERAIFKITSLPAQKYGLNKRGLIKEGYYADIVVLRDFQPSEVLINGQVVLKNKQLTGVLGGRILKSQ